MSTRDCRSRLRAILGGDRCVPMASIFDPISARLADDMRFEAGLMGGSLASYAVLGAPDLILITLTELAEQVHRCTRAGAVPLVVDADHGYGNALNVMRTIEELDHAGASGVMIEDTLLPRAYGASAKPQLLPLEESIGKIKAAVAARGESDLVVLGRTSAATITNVDDAIARLSAYEAAGVDALFVPGLRTRDELDRLSAAVRLPIVTGSPAEALADEAYLASRRVRLWSAGHQTFSIAVEALRAAMQAVRDGTAPSRLAGVASKDVLDRATAATTYDQSIRRYLGGA
jgi:carboxyvinyl-carboxyphosphonate phosphorylmutase